MREGGKRWRGGERGTRDERERERERKRERERERERGRERGRECVCVREGRARLGP